MTDMTYWKDMENVLRTRDYLVLDTETTGIRAPFEICQIAILDAKTEQVVLNELVKTARPIPAMATAIHGITNEAVAKMPTWAQTRWFVLEKLRGRTVITYNAKYDRWALHESDRAAGLEPYDYHKETAWHCAMLYYADFYGEWDEYHGNNRWHSLGAACAHIGIAVEDAHSALADCRSTLALVNAVIAKRPADPFDVKAVPL